MPAITTTPLRRTAGLLAILALLGVFFSLYFFKYVPEQKRDFHQRAFSQLEQIKTAFNDRNDAYVEMVSSYFKVDPDTIEKDLYFLRSTWYEKEMFKGAPKGSLMVTSTLEPDSSGPWVLKYSINKLYPEKDSVTKLADLRMSLSTVLSPITAPYNDIFDGFLMIRFFDLGQRGEIAFNSGGLSMDYIANWDTLLKKSDIHDVMIEGDQYKLFLYPFKCSGNKLILAGLISQTHYTEGYESIPANLVTAGGILLVLLLITLPLLKIYIIGSRETITNFDLRMIIGSYFLGALTFFFLFSWIFLEKVHSARNRTRLTGLADSIQTSFKNEIRTACRQLREYNRLYLADSCLRKDLADPTYKKQLSDMDYCMHPLIFRQMDRVAWINESGRWVGRWGFKKYRNLPLILVDDRKYFKDMMSNNLLVLKDSPVNDSFCITPLLSKFDGEFSTTIVIRCDSARSILPYKPAMLGLSSKMYSVFNPVMPPKSGFSIIDNTGQIQFDSKIGRSLLSNIFAEIPDNETLRQCVDFRQERYFPSIMLRGRKVALLIKPLPDLQYTILTYLNRDQDKEFELHVLGLSCFFIGCLITLLFLSGYFNEWGQKRTSLLHVPSFSFEWLRPVPDKAGYYRYLMKGISILTCAYITVWAIVEIFPRRHEFSLFALSLFLPFYIAIFYFMLREKQKSPGKPLRPPKPALLIPITALLLMTGYIYLGDVPGGILFWTGYGHVLFIVLCWALLRKSSTSQMYLPDPKGPPDPETTRKLYVNAILMGLFGTVLIPAIGIFFFFFKEEMKTRLKQEKLIMARSIDERRTYLNKWITSYQYNAKDSAFIRDLEMCKGIYFSDKTSVDFSNSPMDSRSAHPPKAYYDLHNFLFGKDNTPLTRGEIPEIAADSSWYFRRIKDSNQLIYKSYNINLYPDSIRLPLTREIRQTSIEMAFENYKRLHTVDKMLLFLGVAFLFLLIYKLTWSLASRLFPSGFFHDHPKYQDGKMNNFLEKAWILDVDLSGLLAKMKRPDNHAPLTASDFRRYEGPLNKEGITQSEYRVLEVQEQLKKIFMQIWMGLSDEEQFVLYDFAVDGLANYKAGTALYTLVQNGLLYVGTDNQLHMMTKSFHNWVLDQSGSEKLVQLMKNYRSQGAWQSFRTPLLLVLASVGIFVFFTQNEVYQKMTGLLTSLSSLIPLMSRFFDKSAK